MSHRLEVCIHRCRGLVAVSGLLGERTDNHEIEVVRHFGTVLGRRLGYLGEMLHRDLDRGFSGERHRPGQKLVEDDSGRVQIRCLIDRCAARLLGREVLGGADDRALLRHLARAGARDAEVRHLDDTLGIDDHVVRLDVPMDDAVAVRVAERREDLPGVRDGDIRGTRSARTDEVLQRPPFDVLHDDEVRAVRLPPVVDRDDVRMGETGRVGGLAPEAFDELVVVRVALVEDLDGDAPAELLVLGEVDVRHAAAADLARNAVARGEERAGESVGGRHLS